MSSIPAKALKLFALGVRDSWSLCGHRRGQKERTSNSTETREKQHFSVLLGGRGTAQSFQVFSHLRYGEVMHADCGTFSGTNFLFFWCDLKKTCATINVVWLWYLYGLTACVTWKLASLERPSRAHQGSLLPPWQGGLLLLATLCTRLCMQPLQVSCFRALLSLLLKSFPWCLACVQLVCCRTPTLSGLLHRGHGDSSFFPLCCNLLCIWIPHSCILDQYFGDNIPHKFGAPRLSERQWKATAVLTLPVTANKLPTLPWAIWWHMPWNVRDGNPLWHRACLFLGWMRMTDCESVWAAVAMLSVSLLSIAAQPAAHASLWYSSYPVSEHTAANHVQNGYLWSNYYSTSEFTVTIQHWLWTF